MYTINVTTAFALRIAPGAPRREFTRGEHVISGDERNHWFMAACIKDGRARLVASEEQGASEEQMSEEQIYAAMTVTELKAKATELGLDAAKNANKAALVQLLLAASASAAAERENAGGGD